MFFSATTAFVFALAFGFFLGGFILGGKPVNQITKFENALWVGSLIVALLAGIAFIAVGIALSEGYLAY